MQPPQTQLVIPQWLALSMPVRLHLKKVFGIPRSEGTNVVDGRVVSDGHTHPDLAHITVPAMQAYVKSDEPDFYVLFSMVLTKAEGELYVPDITRVNVPAPITLKVGGKTFIATEVTAATVEDTSGTIAPLDGVTFYDDDLHTAGFASISKMPVDNGTVEMTVAEDPKPIKAKRAPRKAK